MAATVTEIGTSNVSANPASTITVTTTASVAVGEILFFYFSLLNGSGVTATATAKAGANTMTQDATESRGVGSEAVFLFRYEPGSTLASGTVVTATVTNAGTGSAAKCIKVAGLATGVGLDATAGINQGLSQTPSTGNSGTPPSTDEVFSLAVLAANVGTAGQATVSTTGYTPLTEPVQTTRSQALDSAWKDLTATVSVQNVSWTTTWGANKAWCGIVALYRVAGGGPIANTLTASPGSFAITGAAATLPVARKLSATPAAMQITGAAATLGHNYKMAASPGTVTIAGAAATLPHHYVLSASPGAMVVTGAATTLPVGRKLAAAPGVMTIHGADAAFISPVPQTSADPNVRSPFGSLWNHPF